MVFPEAGLTTMMVPRDTEGFPLISVNVTDLPDYPCLEEVTDPILKVHTFMITITAIK